MIEQEKEGVGGRGKQGCKERRKLIVDGWNASIAWVISIERVIGVKSAAL